MLGSFGTSLCKNLDIFLLTGLALPILVTFLWKLYDKADADSSVKHFLMPTLGFSYFKRKNFNIGSDIGGTYKVDDVFLKIPYATRDGYKIHETKTLILYFDISMKHNITSVGFNLHFYYGITLVFYNIRKEYSLLNVNIDYSSFGSPTGVNTDVYILFVKKWVDIIPHATIGISFTVAKWIKVPMLMLNLAYVPSVKGLVFGGTLGFAMYF